MALSDGLEVWLALKFHVNSLFDQCSLNAQLQVHSKQSLFYGLFPPLDMRTSEDFAEIFSGDFRRSVAWPDMAAILMPAN